jgi:hypothetical protein
VRRLIVMVAALAAVLLVAPASASAQPKTATGGGWVPAPSAPFSFAAGERCDFAVTGQPVVDEVRKRVLSVGPDGSPTSELYVGDLVSRITNQETGKSYDADASGQALIVYAADGSQTWYVHGPVLVGFAANGGTLPRGLYIVDGLYRLQISATGYKTLTIVSATVDDLCQRVA